VDHVDPDLALGKLVQRVDDGLQRTLDVRLDDQVQRGQLALAGLDQEVG